MKNILFIAKNNNSSSYRFRVMEYINLYKTKKITTHSIFLSGSILNYIKTLFYASNYDVIFIQRKLFPKYYFYLLRKVSKKIVFDFDDSIFLDTDGKYSKTRSERFNFTCKNSDLIFAGNKFLLEQAKKYSKKSYLIPTGLDTKKYTNKTNIKQLNLVWIGSKSTSKYLKKIIPYIEPLANKIKKIRLINISDVTIKSKKLKILNVNWSVKNQYQYLAKANIGLAPIEADNWSKGKCSFKLLQYLASGLPVISNSFGMNKEILKNKNLGYLVNKDEDWSVYISLINKTKNYQKYKIESKKFIQEYDINIIFNKIFNLINNL